MFRLKLIRGRSYIGCGITATAASPFVTVEDKEIADYLVDCKRFELIGEVNEDGELANATGQNEPSGNQPPADGPNKGWTNAQLTAYATENGIDLEGATAKADILAKIQEAENAIDYGENE